MDIRLDNLLGIRAQLNAAEPAEKISVNDLVVKAVAAALIKVPELNVQYDEDAGTIRRFRDADISIAVALEDGLITPIVRSANRKSVLEIAEETRTLIDKAKTGSLASEEFQGGTFTISNLGMYGIRDFDAIINPPQCAILAVGAGEQRPVVAAGEMTVATLMTVTLCSDHRIIDGAQAARFLNALKDIIENQSL